MLDELRPILERCSRFSGYKLEAKIIDRKSGRVLVIEEPGAAHPYALTLAIHPIGRFLYAVGGRMEHWAITREEKAVLLSCLQDQEPPPPPPLAMDPFSLRDF